VPRLFFLTSLESEEIVRRRWLLLCLLLPIACSVPPVSSGSETPTLFLRCQDGRVTAYMVVATPAEIGAGRFGDDAVEVRLDSAPSCSENAP
jgi:hypothetical protein